MKIGENIAVIESVTLLVSNRIIISYTQNKYKMIFKDI